MAAMFLKLHSKPKCWLWLKSKLVGIEKDNIQKYIHHIQAY